VVIPPAEAWSRIEPHTRPLAATDCPRVAAAGSVLARDLPALADVPGGDVSAMDGYALAGDGTAGATLPVTGTIAAGVAPGARISAGGAMRIMTGAPIPAGADRVIPVEDTDRGVERVTLRASVPAGAHIRRQGEVVRRGAPLLPAGTLLTPGALALLATHGYDELPVHAAPRVGILTTGDEVVPPHVTPLPGQLRDSHTDFLLAASTASGARAHALGIAPDRADVLRARLAEGLANYDVVIVSGGVSMGEFDLVEGVLAELGCEPLFDALAIQPGKPMVAAFHSEGLLFALPGNPASAMVCFWLLVRPALRRLAGLDDFFWREALRAKLTAALPAARDRDRFLPARVRFADGEALVEPLVPLGSHDLAAYARGTALVRAPAGSPERGAGESCEILPLVSWAE
jgi:molybdenum cofactor synthesis domain-containing protein